MSSSHFLKSFSSSFKGDSFITENKNYSLNRKGNVLNIICFTGKSQVPDHAFKTILVGTGKTQHSIQKLSKSNWKNDEPLKLTRKQTFKADLLEISHPEFGILGYIASPIANEIKKLQDKGHKFVAELSDIDGGLTDGTNFKLRINIKFDLPENDTLENIPEEVSNTIKQLKLNPETKNNVFRYSPPLAPEDILSLLVPEEVVNSITKEINKANSILLISHKYPDGDAIGSCLALKAALKHLGKEVDSSIDDEIDGLYRHKLPGIDDGLKKPSELDKNKKYDLAILMDTPIPERTGENISFIKNAKQLIFIDHHPLTRSKWLNTSIDTDKLEKQNLLWVRPEIPAVTEMVGALIFNLLPKHILDNLNEEQKQQIAKPLVAGMATDTVFFRKNINHGVESFSKYLMNWANFGKKWVRDTIDYHLPKPALKRLNEYMRNGIIRENDINYASMQIPYEKFMDVYNTAKKVDKDVILMDVVNEIKYSDLFYSLQKNPKTHSDDTIAALILERAKKEIDGHDFISVNLRSGSSTDFARKIALSIGGGGHANMAASQIYTHGINDEVYENPDNHEKKLTLERKIATLARKLRTEAKEKTVAFAGWITSLNQAS
ncbi:MAG: DHH family phosphoesterase [Cyanobacteriota bacterium]